MTFIARIVSLGLLGLGILICLAAVWSLLAGVSQSPPQADTAQWFQAGRNLSILVSLAQFASGVAFAGFSAALWLLANLSDSAAHIETVLERVAWRMDAPIEKEANPVK
jgi:hypothetical protein